MADAYRRSAGDYLSRGSLDYRPPDLPNHIIQDPELREKLHNLFEGSCAYCETHLPDFDFEVDHYRPISGAVTGRGVNGETETPNLRRYLWLALEWENLFPACKACLRGKRNFFPVTRKAADGPEDDLSREHPVLLNPCVDHPAEHLNMVEGGILRGRTARGATTIELLSLNRAELVGQRRDLLRQSGLQERGPADRETARLAVPAMLRPSQPFRGIVAIALFTALPASHPFMAWRRRRDLSFEDIRRVIAAIQSDEPERSRRQANPVPIETSEQRYLRRIEIENFKGIRQLVLDFPEGGKQAGKAAGSLAILGDNGTGKTSILQATALAAMGLDRAREDTLKPSDCLPNDAQAGKIILHFLDTDQINVIRFDRSSDRFEGETPIAMTVLGYGAYRLPAHGPTHHIRRRTDARVHSLFDERALVNGPYGIETDLRRLRRPERLQRGHNVASTLNALFDGLADARTDDNGNVGIFQDGMLFPIPQLSSGFKSVLALATDVMDVMYKRWGGLESAQALILIDEIDAHLHPSWRLRVVEDLKRAFPLSQLLVTSHDPLVLRGLASEEVRLLDRGDGRALRALRPAVPTFDGLTVDQLLTSDLFGLRSTYSNDISIAAAEYYALLAKGAPSDEDEQRMAELRAQVDLYGISGRTRRERLLYAVIDRHLAKAAAKKTVPGDAWDREVVDQLLAEFEEAEAAEDGAGSDA